MNQRSDEIVRVYAPQWGATDVDYDAPWELREDGRIGADRMRSAAVNAGWHQMRQIVPRQQWSVELCDAIVESTLRVVRDWQHAP